MRYRRLDADGDYTFGNGQADFLINSPACVGQLVETRLLLIEGEWFLDKSQGVPYMTEVLGYGTQPIYDLVIRQFILDTLGVTAIDSYSSTLNPVNRELSVSADIDTQYGKTSVSVVL